MGWFNDFRSVRWDCRKSESSFLKVLGRYLYYRIRYSKRIIANENVIIKGVDNIEVGGVLRIGVDDVGFMYRKDATYINVSGRLVFSGDYSIAKGCRFAIGDGALVEIGSGYVNPNTSIIIMHRLFIGDETYISWGCEFLDEDFHELIYDGKQKKLEGIEIGGHVWIGSRVTVLKGSRIPSGCVVASGSVITKAFNQANCLIGGNPARIMREDIAWK